MTIYGVYFPSTIKKAPVFDFFLNGSYSPENESYLIIGNFNTGRHTFDEAGHTFYCVDRFESLLANVHVDSWRSRNREERTYSCFTSGGNGFRLDHVFSTHVADSRIQSIHGDHSPPETGLTDHSALIAEFRA